MEEALTDCDTGLRCPATVFYLAAPCSSWDLTPTREVSSK